MKLKVVYKRTTVSFQDIEIFGESQEEIVEKGKTPLQVNRLTPIGWVPDRDTIEIVGVE